jgi:hypothetical protein
MAKINVFGLGLASKTPYVTAKGLTNMYAETRPAGEKSAMVGYRTPGLTGFADVGGFSPPRGARPVEKTNTAYVVIGNAFYQVSGSGVMTNLGTLSTSVGRVSMSDNGVQVMIVDGLYGYIYNINTGVFVQITDVDFPANPLTVTFLSARFVINVAASSRFYVSDLNDGLSWDALNFANAETNPDPIIAVWASNGQLILLGSVSMEYWGDSGALDFPFTLIKGTATEWGLAATWSVAKYDNSIACLIKNRMGQVMVAKIAGYLPQKISTPDIDNIINGYATVSDASVYTYMLGGHAMLVISFPTAGYTWLYDGLTSMWSSLKGQGITRHRAEFGFSFLTKTIVTDYQTGILYTLSKTALTDNGRQIESEIISENISSPDDERITVDKLRVDIEVGQGSVAVEYPQIGLSVSRDNGKTYDAEMMRDIGPIGEYKKTVDWNMLGTARAFVFKLRMSDPFAFTLVSAIVNPPD